MAARAKSNQAGLIGSCALLIYISTRKSRPGHSTLRSYRNCNKNNADHSDGPQSSSHIHKRWASIMQLVLVLLRIVSFFAVLCCLGQAAPAMNALQDESRLDDGIYSPLAGFCGRG